MHKRTRHRHVRSALRSALLAAVLAAGPAPALAQTAPSTEDNDVANSVNQTAGIVGINQQVGDANNQANITSIALSGAVDSAALASIIAAQTQLGVVTGDAGPPVSAGNDIEGSFNNTQGIAQVNQAAGKGNNQLNIVALAFAPGASFSPALTDTELQQISDPNQQPVHDYVGQGNVMNNSFNNFSGIAQVSQVAGAANMITNVVAMAIGGGG